MSGLRELAEEARRFADRAVTEGVNLKYVQQMRVQLYNMASALLAAEERQRALEGALTDLLPGEHPGSYHVIRASDPAVARARAALACLPAAGEGT